MNEKIARIATATLAVTMLSVAVLKAQGCSKRDAKPKAVPEKVEPQRESSENVVKSTTVTNSATNDAPKNLPTTNGSALQNILKGDDKMDYLPTSKVGGFIPSGKGFGYGGLGLRGSTNGGEGIRGIGDIGKPTSNTNQSE